MGYLEPSCSTKIKKDKETETNKMGCLEPSCCPMDNKNSLEEKNEEINHKMTKPNTSEIEPQTPHKPIEKQNGQKQNKQ